jgi:hypothetical protein
VNPSTTRSGEVSISPARTVSKRMRDEVYILESGIAGGSGIRSTATQCARSPSGTHQLPKIKAVPIPESFLRITFPSLNVENIAATQCMTNSPNYSAILKNADSNFGISR